MLDLPAPAQALNIATAKPITTILAVFVPAEGILTTTGPKRLEQVMCVPVAQSITNVRIAVQLKPDLMPQHRLIMVEPDAMCDIPAHGIHTVRQVDNMCGTVITTFCVATAEQYRITNGAQCTVM